MNYNIIVTTHFERCLKHLYKKYRSIKQDLADFIEELRKNPEVGIPLDKNTFKIRMSIKSKGKGKSGGARVITCNVLVGVSDTDIYLLTIYDKADQDSISDLEIKKLKKLNGLES
ncbi:MAG: addiction module toxin RelE [Dysgonamonadaceae bacterium]|jgi:mRNA-degrading endonuclease RelE of RelBE toxin-antitoxin system|nr:addiction module toxin RelE [Dysgonamonadaceae bacterium]